MARGCIGRSAGHIALAILLALLFPAVACAQSEDAAQLARQADALFKAGRYDDALTTAARRVVLTMRGQNSENIVNARTSVAWYALFAKQPEKALAASELALNLAPYALPVETNHAHALLFLGRTEEARAIYLGHKGEPIEGHGKWEAVIAQDFRELRSHGLDHPAMAGIEAMLAKAAGSPRAQCAADIAAFREQIDQLYEQGKYDEAPPIAEKALVLAERVLGREHPSTLVSADNLAVLYMRHGRYAEAEPLFRRALEAQERLLGREHPSTLTSVNNLAEFYQGQGRYGEAEALLRRALEVRERVLGKEHPSTLSSVNNLALLYLLQDRHAEAEPLFRRALEARERLLGREDPSTLTSVNNLALLYHSQGRHAEAEPFYRRALEVHERLLGREHPNTLTSASNLALLYERQGRHAEAEPLFRRALDGRERLLGREHPDTLMSVNNLATLYQDQGWYAEAEPLYRRAIEAQERLLGGEHPSTLTSVSNLGMLYFAQRDWSRAAELWRRSTAAIAQRTQRGALDAGLAGKKKSESEQSGWQFLGLIKAAYRLALEGRSPNAATSQEMFQTAQWALSSEAAQALQQMAARSAKGDGPLAKVVRERQDLVAEWQKRESWRNKALGQEAAKRNAKVEAENNARLAAIGARIAGIDKPKFGSCPGRAA